MLDLQTQFFLAGLLGSLTGAGTITASLYMLYRLEMKQRRKVSKGLEAEFNNLMNSIKGLDRGPSKGSKLH